MFNSCLLALKLKNVNLITVTPGNSPIITQCTSILANIDRTGQKMENTDLSLTHLSQTPPG